MILVFLVVYLRMEPPRILSYVLLYAAVSNGCEIPDVLHASLSIASFTAITESQGPSFFCSLSQVNKKNT